MKEDKKKDDKKEDKKKDDKKKDDKKKGRFLKKLKYEALIKGIK